MKNLLYITLFSILLSNCTKTPSLKEVPEDIINTNQQASISISETQFKSSNMSLGSISKKTFPDLVKVTGTIDVPPQNKEIISSFYGGYVKRTPLLIGDKVKNGQALVTIQNPYFIEIQQNYLELVEQLVYLKSEYNRQKTLFNEKITSQKNYLKAESDYKRNIAMSNGLRKKLQMLNINLLAVEQGKFTSEVTLYSSISGSITKINIIKGAYVSPADAIMEIVNTEHIHIELSAFEKDIMSIKEKQRINFKIPESSNVTYEAEVHLIGTSIDENTRTVKIHGHLFDDEQHNFAIGMFVDAEIETAHNESMAIPENAIVEIGEKKVVFVLEKFENKNYRFNMVEVKTKKNHNGFVEIVSETLKKDAKILIEGAYTQG